jgi:hypothetical protein
MDQKNEHDNQADDDPCQVLLDRCEHPIPPAFPPGQMAAGAMRDSQKRRPDTSSTPVSGPRVALAGPAAISPQVPVAGCRYFLMKNSIFTPASSMTS